MNEEETESGGNCEEKQFTPKIVYTKSLVDIIQAYSSYNGIPASSFNLWIMAYRKVLKKRNISLIVSHSIVLFDGTENHFDSHRRLNNDNNNHHSPSFFSSLLCNK